MASIRSSAGPDSDLILGELPRLAHKPSPARLLDRIRQRTPVGAPFRQSGQLTLDVAETLLVV